MGPACLHLSTLHSNLFHICRRNGCRLQASDNSLDTPLKCANTNFGPWEMWRCRSASQSSKLEPTYMRKFTRKTPPLLQITNLGWQDRVRAIGFANADLYAHLLCPHCHVTTLDSLPQQLLAHPKLLQVMPARKMLQPDYQCGPVLSL